MEREILKVIKKSWDEFIDFKKEKGDFRDREDYSVAEFLEWLE